MTVAYGVGDEGPAPGIGTVPGVDELCLGSEERACPGVGRAGDRAWDQGWKATPGVGVALGCRHGGGYVWGWEPPGVGDDSWVWRQGCVWGRTVAPNVGHACG